MPASLLEYAPLQPSLPACSYVPTQSPAASRELRRRSPAGPGWRRLRQDQRDHRKIAYLVQQCGIAPYIVAVTFTNKAAREMKERVGTLLRGGEGKA